MTARILVVDDDAEIAMLVRRVLQLEGHHPLVITDPVRAVERFRASPFDLLITDKAMRGMTGFELIASLRELAPALPVVMMSAYPELVGPLLPIQGYLAKPFARLQRIVDVVEDTLKLARGLQAVRAFVRAHAEPASPRGV